MARNPILVANTNTAAVANAETMIVKNLPGVLGKVGIPINGKVMSATQIVALVQSHLDAATHVANLRAQLKSSIQSEDELHATIKAAVNCIRSYVAAMYGERSTQYASLGFDPRKEAQKTAKSKAQAVDKSLATRAARHTMGKKQRGDIFGEVPATPSASPAPVTATPVVSTSAAAPAPAATNGVAPSAAPANGTSGH